MASLLRKPASVLTSLTQPPRPGTPGFALWKRFTGLNTTVFRLSGGRLLGTYDGNPVLERERLWPRLVEHHPAFSTHQGRTEREIPVVILAPRR
jgi:F420H(2)-dependent quinone reductase